MVRHMNIRKDLVHTPGNIGKTLCPAMHCIFQRSLKKRCEHSIDNKTIHVSTTRFFNDRCFSGVSYHQTAFGFAFPYFGAHRLRAYRHL